MLCSVGQQCRLLLYCFVVAGAATITKKLNDWRLLAESTRDDLLGAKRAGTRETVSWAMLAFAISYFLVRFVSVVVTNHRNFGSTHFDIGVFDQAAYLLAHGDQFLTSRGLSVFGHHANFGLYLFSPFYWLGLGGPILLNVAAILSFAASAVPIYLLTKRRTGSPGLGVVIAVAFLGHFSVSAMINEAFHPEGMAIPALFGAFYFADLKRWAPYAALLVYAVSWKEDVALFVMMLGVYVFFTSSRRSGLITAGTAGVYFLIMTSFVIPAFNDGGSAFYAVDYGALGDSSIEVAANATLFNRDEAFRILGQNDASGFFFDLGQPYGWLSYLSPHWMLLALPQLGANLLNVHGLAANPFAHYVSIPLVALTLGLIALFTRCREGWLRTVLSVWVLVFAFNTATSRGFTPHSDNYTSGVWQLYDNDRSSRLRGALDAVPEDAVIAGSFNLTPHLTNRRGVYLYPNPFEAHYWGIGQTAQHDPSVIDYLVLDRDALGAESKQLAQELGSTEFEPVYEKGPVIVLRRVR